MKVTELTLEEYYQLWEKIEDEIGTNMFLAGCYDEPTEQIHWKGKVYEANLCNNTE